MIIFSRVVVALVLLLGFATYAAAQSLKIADRKTSRTVTAQQLLADPATHDIAIDKDSSYGRAMTYRAIPATELLKGLAVGTEDYVEFTAVDRFSIGVPARLLLGHGAAAPRAFLAIATAGAPWPPLPDHGKETAAPFYLVWQNANPAEVSSEYWVFKLASLQVTDSPFKQWPSLNVSDDLPATIRRAAASTATSRSASPAIASRAPAMASRAPTSASR